MRNSLAAATALLFIIANSSWADIFESFETQTVGQFPTGWSGNVNGRTLTGNGGLDGSNKIMALHDASPSANLFVRQTNSAPTIASEITSGVIKFDIRIGGSGDV